MADTLYDIKMEFAENLGNARVDVRWASASNTNNVREAIESESLWSNRRINGVNDIVIAPASSPNFSTVESMPAGDSIDLQNTDTATYTVQSRSADGTAQPVQNDVYTAKLTCNDANICGTEEFTATGVHTTDGLYSIDFMPTVPGPYDVVINMENAYTASLLSSNNVFAQIGSSSSSSAQEDEPTIVSTGMTLTVADTRSVPSGSTVESQPEHLVHTETPLSWTF